MTYIDLSVFNSGLIDWEELWEDDLDLPENFCSLLEQSVVLDDIYYKIVVSYLLCNSAICQVLPSLFLYGNKGTGKSTIGFLASKLHNIHIHTSADTFASIRNDLDSRKYVTIAVPDPKYDNRIIPKKIEKHCLLIWDDIDENTFRDYPNLYRIFKSGYDRSSDTVSIAKSPGKNVRFKCFSAKIISSTYPFHSDTNYTELGRRILPIITKKLDFYQGKKKAEDLLNLNLVNWVGIEKKYQEFWSSEYLAQTVRDFRQKLIKITMPFDSHKRAISLDLMAIGLASYLFFDIDEAIAYWDDYWKTTETKVISVNALKELLSDYLEKHLKEIQSCYPDEFLPRETYSISSTALKAQVELWEMNGALDDKLTPKLISQTMRELDWYLSKGKWFPSWF
jgi:hypothetical protein